MNGKPQLIAYDVETTGLEFYREDFRVLSAAFSWFLPDGSVKSVFKQGEAEIASFLVRIQEAEIPLVVHNIQFEYGVTKCRFPWFNLDLLKYDTMRLAQVADNGGKKAQKQELTLEDELTGFEKVRTGLGLQAVTQRWLPSEFHNHKEPYYQWLRENGVKKGKEGANLHLLPPDTFEAYNVADTEITLRLYKRFTDLFTELKYDWRLDHSLYLNSARLITESKIRGVPVNRPKLAFYAFTLREALLNNAERFKDRFRPLIDEIEQENLIDIVMARKTEKGQANAWEACLEDRSLYEFNVGSTQQLAKLFVGKLKMTAKFTTDKGAPSFKSAFLSQWGEGGLMLKTRRTKLIALKQAEALLDLSKYDGRWHIDLRACGTSTGRFAGGRSG